MVMYMVLETFKDLVRGNHVFAFILYDPSELKPQGLVCNPTRDKQVHLLAYRLVGKIPRIFILEVVCYLQPT